MEINALAMREICVLIWDMIRELKMKQWRSVNSVALTRTTQIGIISCPFLSHFRALKQAKARQNLEKTQQPTIFPRVR